MMRANLTRNREFPYEEFRNLHKTAILVSNENIKWLWQNASDFETNFVLIKLS